MLILTRRVGEKLFILCPDGSRIELMITGVGSHGRVRIGLTAPQEYRIVREELLERETDAD